MGTSALQQGTSCTNWQCGTTFSCENLMQRFGSSKRAAQSASLSSQQISFRPFMSKAVCGFSLP